MSLLSGVMDGGEKRPTSWHIYHQTQIIVERRYDGTGQCKDIACVKRTVREFINWSGGSWSKRQKSEARQRVVYLTTADIIDRNVSFG